MGDGSKVQPPTTAGLDLGDKCSYLCLLDLEGACRVVEHLDLTGVVVLDPDGGIRLSGVAQQRASFSPVREIFM
jgi:hypothetical protein